MVLLPTYFLYFSVWPMCTRLHTSRQIFLREYYQERLCMVLEPLALVSALTLAMVLQYVIAKCIMLAKNKLLKNQLTHDSTTTRKSPICFVFRFKLLITAALVALAWCIIDASQNRQLLMTRSHRQDRRSLCPGNEAGHVVIGCSAKKSKLSLAIHQAITPSTGAFGFVTL